MIAAQPGVPPRGERLWGRWLRPDLVLSPSPRLVERLKARGVSSEFLPMGVETDDVQPVDEERKKRLRETYGLPLDRPLVLHVGHLSPNRNLGWLRTVSEQLDVSVAMVAGTSLGSRADLRSDLTRSGVVVLDDFFPRIRELYEAADCYVFPVVKDNGAIGVPLSVLEAMSVNLPVVTTGFGGLPYMFAGGDGLTFADSLPEFVQAVEAALRLRDREVSTKDLARLYSWPNVVERVRAAAQSVASN